MVRLPDTRMLYGESKFSGVLTDGFGGGTRRFLQRTGAGTRLQVFSHGLHQAGAETSFLEVEPTCRAIIVAELLTTYMVILATPVAVAKPAVALLLILIGPPLLDLERGLNLSYPFLLLYFLRILNKVKSNNLDMDVLSLFLQNVKDFIQYADRLASIKTRDFLPKTGL